MIRKYLYLIISFTLITSILISNANARMKCWTNSDGVKECGDKVPPEYTQQGYQELGKGGMVREKTDRVKTKEELKKEKIESEAIFREKEKIKNQKARDKMLLETFTSVEEIKSAQEQKIQAVESTIKVTRKRIIKLQYLLDDEIDNNSVDKQIDDEDDEETSKNDTESLKKQISENKNYIKKKMEEQKQIKKTYSEYIVRFKELRRID
ncbi:MAG: hypothetical protein VYC15_02850 [Pseudomonadota bacterium]|nr:hypothetical protein [Pseudomonadota bacterium]